jgi:predicted secreted protein
MSGTSTQNATIRVGDGASPQVWTDIGCITDFQGPNGSRQVIDTTCLSDSGRTKNVGIPNYGQVSLKMVHDASDTEQVALWNSFKGGTKKTYRIIIPDSPEDYIEFQAYCLNYSFQAAVDEVIRSSASLEIDGAVTDSF